MKELSLHILDIVQNSTQAGATEVRIEILEDVPENLFMIIIRDNGCGIKQELLATVTKPFATTRTTRRVGLGLALLQAAAEQCKGSLRVESEEQKGTMVSAIFEHDHIDRVPLGDIVSTLISLIIGNADVDFSYGHQVNEHRFELNTKDIKKELGEIPISELSVINFLTEYLQEHIARLYKEANI